MGTGSSRQCGTGAMADRRSGYMIAGAFLPPRGLEGFTIQKQLLEWSVGSLQIRGTAYFMDIFSPLYHPAKEQNKTMSINIYVFLRTNG